MNDNLQLPFENLDVSSHAKRTNYRLAEPEEESKGIDGYIGDVPVSIKPHTYKIKASLPERRLME